MSVPKSDFIGRVMAVLNDIERDYAYDPSLTPRYVEELFPQAWRTAARAWPARWFEPVPIPLVRSWDVTVTTDEYGGFALPTLPEEMWEVTDTHYDQATGVARATVHVETGQVRQMEDGTGFVLLPEDFLRLYRFKLRGWRVAAYEAQEATAHVDALQSNRYTRGTPERPVVVLRPCEYYSYPPAREGEKPDINDWEPVSGYALWYYSVAAGRHLEPHHIEEATYVRDLTEMPEELPVTHECVAPLTYLVASRVCLSMEQAEQAARLMAMVDTLI